MKRQQQPDEYLKLTEISRRSSLSVRTIKKHLNEIPHCQPTRSYLIKWSDFEAWLQRSRRDALSDPYVRRIVERMAEAGVA